MYQLRYYYSRRDLELKTLNYQIVDTYPNKVLAYGMRKKKALEPNYVLELLLVVEV